MVITAIICLCAGFSFGFIGHWALKEAIEDFRNLGLSLSLGFRFLGGLISFSIVLVSIVKLFSTLAVVAANRLV